MIMDLVQQEFNMELNYIQNLSPILPEGVKNYLIDIDGTITEDVPNEDLLRMASVYPYDGSVQMINKWFDDGHIITFFTSRTEEHRNVTELWLSKHSFKYHLLLMNKPRGGNYHWIDNHIVRATRYEGKWTELTKKEHLIEVFE